MNEASADIGIGAGSDSVIGWQRAQTTSTAGTAYESPITPYMSFQRPTLTTPKGSRYTMDYSAEPPKEALRRFVLETDDLFDASRCVAAELETSVADAWAPWLKGSIGEGSNHSNF